jgi:hypothetical protein
VLPFGFALKCDNAVFGMARRTPALANGVSEGNMHCRSLLAFAMLMLLSGLAAAQGVPAKLAPPPDSTLIGKYAAKGVQIYVCSAKGGATEWVLKAPEAELRDERGAVFAKHYAGPTWEAADGSKAVGKVMVSEPSPRAGAIAWLLLSATPSGSGALSDARFVQRLNTSGGAAPAGACATAGSEQRIDYAADYLFYK